MPTYYVSSADGNDGDDGLSEADAWLTVQKALDTVAAGDTVYVKGTFQEALTVPTAGTTTQPITFRGYETVITDDGLATLDGNSKALASGITLKATANYYVWDHFRITDYSSSGITTPTGDHVCFRYCEIDNNGLNGLGADQSIVCIGCHIHDNTLHGANVKTGIFLSCIIDNNGSHGLTFTGTGAVVQDCLIRNSTDNGINIPAAGIHSVCGNTIDGNGKNTSIGIRVAGLAPVTMANNIIYDCAVGIEATAAGDVWGSVASVSNILFNNTANYNNSATSAFELLTDPGFMDEENKDYTPVHTSETVGTAWDIRTVPNGPNQTGNRNYRGAVAPTPPNEVVNTLYGVHIRGDLP